jgi:hypothetical protein
LEVIGTFLMIGVVTPLVMLGFVGVYWGRTRARERLSDAWAAYARRRGLTFGAPSGEWPNRTPPSIQWVEDGAAYRIEARGAETTVTTRVVARPTVAVFGELFVTRPDGEAALKAGAEPLLGRLIVRAHPAGFAARVLTGEVKRALLGFDPLSLVYRGGEVSLGWAGGEKNDARLDEASSVVRRVLGALAVAYDEEGSDPAPAALNRRSRT